MTPCRPRYWLVALFLLAGMGQALANPALSTSQYIEQLQSYEIQLAELSLTPQNAVALRDSLPRGAHGSESAGRDSG